MKREDCSWVKWAVLIVLVALLVGFLWPAFASHKDLYLRLQAEARTVFTEAVAAGKVFDPPPSPEVVQIRSRHGGLPMMLSYHNAKGEYVIYSIIWARREDGLHWRFTRYSEPKQELILPRLPQTGRQEPSER